MKIGLIGFGSMGKTHSWCVKNLRYFYKDLPFEAEYAGKMQLYLTALDEQVKLPDENPSIGIIICKSKDKTYVEYALKRMTAPIGVATYRLQSTLPEDMRDMLPQPEEIAERLKIFEQE